MKYSINRRKKTITLTIAGHIKCVTSYKGGDIKVLEGELTNSEERTVKLYAYAQQNEFSMIDMCEFVDGPQWRDILCDRMQVLNDVESYEEKYNYSLQGLLHQKVHHILENYRDSHISAQLEYAEIISLATDKMRGVMLAIDTMLSERHLSKDRIDFIRGMLELSEQLINAKRGTDLFNMKPLRF